MSMRPTALPGELKRERVEDAGQEARGMLLSSADVVGGRWALCPLPVASRLSDVADNAEERGEGNEDEKRTEGPHEIARNVLVEDEVEYMQEERGVTAAEREEIEMGIVRDAQFPAGLCALFDVRADVLAIVDVSDPLGLVDGRTRSAAWIRVIESRALNLCSSSNSVFRKMKATADCIVEDRDGRGVAPSVQPPFSREVAVRTWRLREGEVEVPRRDDAVECRGLLLVFTRPPVRCIEGGGEERCVPPNCAWLNVAPIELRHAKVGAIAEVTVREQRRPRTAQR